MPRILIVDDEENARKILALNLRQEGFEVLAAGRGDRAVELAAAHRPEVVLLDVNLPGLNGFDVCKTLRQTDLDTRIILLTVRGGITDRVVGLEIGADDYLVKPFSIRELVARIRAHLRRLAAPASPARCEFGEIKVDFEKRIAVRNGERLELTSKEFDLLRLLIRHRGEVVSREQILGGVWGYDGKSTTRTVDTHISNLRHKLERDAKKPECIQSAYGEGYRFVG